LDNTGEIKKMGGGRKKGGGKPSTPSVSHDGASTGATVVKETGNNTAANNKLSPPPSVSKKDGTAKATAPDDADADEDAAAVVKTAVVDKWARAATGVHYLPLRRPLRPLWRLVLSRLAFFLLGSCVVFYLRKTVPFPEEMQVGVSDWLHGPSHHTVSPTGRVLTHNHNVSEECQP
jgi:hypothetical protein